MRLRKERPAVEQGPWGPRDGAAPAPSWRDKIPEGFRRAMVGHDGLIQRTSRFLLKLALLAGAAAIVPPLLGVSTVLTLAMLSFCSAAVLGYLSWIHDLIEGRKLSAAARNRRRGLWLAATIYMVGVMVLALVSPAQPSLPSPAPAVAAEKVLP
ncbi:MAG: hypothetical protein ACK4Z5_00025 [Brevundimonas sp.]